MFEPSKVNVDKHYLDTQDIFNQQSEHYKDQGVKTKGKGHRWTQEVDEKDLPIAVEPMVKPDNTPAKPVTDPTNQDSAFAIHETKEWLDYKGKEYHTFKKPQDGSTDSKSSPTSAEKPNSKPSASENIAKDINSLASVLKSSEAIKLEGSAKLTPLDVSGKKLTDETPNQKIQSDSKSSTDDNPTQSSKIDVKNMSSKILDQATLFMVDSFDPKSSPIPKIIHQQNATKTESMLVEDFIEKNDGFLHLFWTDEDLEVFVQKHHPSIHKLYTELPYNILRSDLARYLLLYTFGGVYADIDTKLVRKIKDWSDGVTAGLIIGMEVDVAQDWVKNHPRSLGFCQWAMAAKPEHPIIETAIAEIVKRLDQADLKNIKVDDAVLITGSPTWTEVVINALEAENVQIDSLNQLKSPALYGDVYVLPMTAFSNVGDEKSVKDGETRIRHFLQGSWLQNDEQTKNAFLNKLEEKLLPAKELKDNLS